MPKRSLRWNAVPPPLRCAMRDAIGQPVIDWLRNRPLTLRSGDYLFCHAGVRPGVPIAKQSREDILWIRNAFLENTRPFDVKAVHGHSISIAVERCDNRIGIDTGAYRSGVLTAVSLEGCEHEILSNAPDV